MWSNTLQSKETNLASDISLSEVEISGVDSDRPLAFDWRTLSESDELGSFLCPPLQADTGVLLSQRMFPSDSDLLMIDLSSKGQVLKKKKKKKPYSHCNGKDCSSRMFHEFLQKMPVWMGLRQKMDLVRIKINTIDEDGLLRWGTSPIIKDATYRFSKPFSFD